MSRTQKVCISGFTVETRREIVIAALHKSSMGDGNEHCVEICAYNITSQSMAFKITRRREAIARL